jgi:hypothetical protein
MTGQPLSRKSALNRQSKGGRCRHCKTRLDEGEAALHDRCVDPWFQANREKLRAKALKVDRAETKKKLDKLKSRAKWEDECRKIVQKIARIRDKDDGCISCDLPATWDGQWHGSHFRSHGAASAVQLHLWNIHKSCSACNLHKSGNLENYRPRLIDKIGQDRVDWLMAQNGTFKPPMDYYPRFKRVMGKRLRRLEKRAST